MVDPVECESLPDIPPTYRTPHGLSPALRERVLGKSQLTLGMINPDGSPHLTLLLEDVIEEPLVVEPAFTCWDKRIGGCGHRHRSLECSAPLLDEGVFLLGHAQDGD